MNFVAVHLQPLLEHRRGESGAYSPPGDFFMSHDRGGLYETESCDLLNGTFNMVRVRQPSSQHLESAAHPEDQSALFIKSAGVPVPSYVLHELHIADGVLSAWEDQKVRASRLHGASDIAHRHPGIGHQRRKIREVRDVRQLNDGYVHHAPSTADPRQTVVGNGVLFVHKQFRIEGDHAQDRFAGHVLKLRDARFQQIEVAAEPVDDESANALLFRFGQQVQGTFHPGEHAAAVDVAHDHHRCVGHFRHCHVDHIVLTQVDFGGRSGALHDDEFVFIF